MSDYILEKLASSKDDAKSAVDIARELNIPVRTIHSIIREKRRQGVPIVSDRGGKGFWIAKTPGEIRAWARQSQASAYDTITTAIIMLSIADSMEDAQIRMF